MITDKFRRNTIKILPKNKQDSTLEIVGSHFNTISEKFK